MCGPVGRTNAPHRKRPLGVFALRFSAHNHLLEGKNYPAMAGVIVKGVIEDGAQLETTAVV